MKKCFLLLSFFTLSQGFSTIVDRLEKIEREIDQYKEAKELEIIEKKSVSFHQNQDWVHIELYPEFLLMQVQQNAKDPGLVYLGNVLGKDWSDNLTQDKMSLPWKYGYRVRGSLSMASYDVSSSFLRYQNVSGCETNDLNDCDINLTKFSLREIDVCLGYRQNWFNILELKRFLGVKKLSIVTKQEGLLDIDHRCFLTQATIDNKFKALGPTAGLGFNLNILGGMNLNVGVGGSILYGKENSSRYFTSGFDRYPLIGFMPKTSYSSTWIPSFEFKLGGGCHLVDAKNLLLALSVGYEAHYYYLNHPMNHLGESLSSFLVMDFDKKHSLLSDLTLFGTVVRVEAKF